MDSLAQDEPFECEHALQVEYCRRPHDKLVRYARLNGCETEHHVLSTYGSPSWPEQNADPCEEFELAVLKGARVRSSHYPRGTLRIVDVCSGAGGLSLAAREAAELLGYTARYNAVVDTDRSVLSIYQRNFDARYVDRHNINMLVDFGFSVGESSTKAPLRYRPTIVDPVFGDCAGGCDLFLAGPPCQGYSSANNRTRGNDPRNDLYVTAAAMGCALEANTIVLENVPSIERDHRQSLYTAINVLTQMEYHVRTIILDASSYGTSQTRKRHFLLANKVHQPQIETAHRIYTRQQRPISWSIGDLVRKEPQDLFDTPAELSAKNRQRIDYLFSNELYDLPDKQRPVCHQNGHTYPAVYGRLRWDDMSGTITQGFSTPGRGRYVHPDEKRCLTPHEAARLQSFPDSFRFELPNGQMPKRRVLTKAIGEAVPPWLGRVACLAAMLGSEIYE